jgi:hypothetical protein
MDTIDFAVGWPVSDEEDILFIRTLKSECKARKLSFLFVSEESLEALTGKVKKGALSIKFYLDLASETYKPKNKFMRFNYCLKDSGTRIVDDPDEVKSAADKSITHFDLFRSKISVPYTILIRHWEPTRRLTEDEKKRLGLPFVVKPALGYGQKGVKIIKERISLKEIAQARKFSPGDNFLLQEFIKPIELGGWPAWFRVFNLFGEIMICWWHPVTKEYRQLTLREMDDYNLAGLARIASEIGRITRIDWFSCEIAINSKNKKMVVIDYMNDQCAIDPQSEFKSGMPDELIVHIAERMVEKSWQYIKGRYTLSYRAIWFPKIRVKDENA